MDVPEPAQRAGQPQPDLGASPRLTAPSQGGAQVVMLALQAYQPLALPRTTELGLGGLREPEIVLRVSPARGLGLATFFESLSAILPQRLQDLVTERPLGRRLGQHEGLADQAGQEIQGGELAIGGGRWAAVVGERGPGRRHDRLDRFQRAPPREDGQAVEQRALGLAQQVVAPLDRLAERPLAHRGGPSAAGQQREPVVQPGCDLVGGQDGHPGGGQLDSERNAVQPAADLHDRLAVALRQLEQRQHQPGPFHEEPDRLELAQLVQPRRSPVRHRQGRDTPDRLAVHAQRLAAGGQDAQARAAAQEPSCQVGAGSDQVLAVVEHQQDRAGADRLGQRVDRRAPRSLLHRQGSGHRRCDKRAVQERRQLHEGGYPGGTGRRPGHLEGQASLAHPSRAGQREQAGRLQEPPDLDDLLLPADEAAERHRQGRA
jgi:hypothetical protein